MRNSRMSEQLLHSRRVVAKPFKDLLTKVVSLFGSKEELTLIGVIIANDSIDEYDLSSVMKLDKTTLNRLISRLVRDRLISQRSLPKKVENMLPGKPKWFYYPNYITLVDIIRIKLHRVGELLENHKRTDKGILYKCVNTRCAQTLEEMDLYKAFDPTQNLFFCPSCKGPIVEIVLEKSEEEEKKLESMVNRFNAYTKELSRLMQKCVELYDLKLLDGIPKPRRWLIEEELATVVHVQPFKSEVSGEMEWSTTITEPPRKKSMPEWFSSTPVEVKMEFEEKDAEINKDIMKEEVERLLLLNENQVGYITSSGESDTEDEESEGKDTGNQDYFMKQEVEELLLLHENKVGYITSSEESDTEDQISLIPVTPNFSPSRMDEGWADKFLPWRKERFRRQMSPCDDEGSDRFTSYFQELERNDSGINKNTLKQEIGDSLRLNVKKLGYITSTKESDIEDELSPGSAIVQNTSHSRLDMEWADKFLPWRKERYRRQMSPCDDEGSVYLTSYF